MRPVKEGKRIVGGKAIAAITGMTVLTVHAHKILMNGTMLNKIQTPGTTLILLRTNGVHRTTHIKIRATSTSSRNKMLGLTETMPRQMPGKLRELTIAMAINGAAMRIRTMEMLTPGRITRHRIQITMAARKTLGIRTTRV
jgi:hypothetical protein